MTRILTDPKLDFRDVLLVPKRSELSSRGEVSLERTYRFKNSKATWTGIGIVAANMDGVGTIEVAKILSSQRLMTSLVKHYDLATLISYFNIEENREYTAYSLGISEDDLVKFENFKQKARAKFVTIDVANGYSQKFIDFVSSFREANPEIILIAGNVATPEIVEQLLVSGADIVKVGIGSGNACSTRIKTGVGYPQLSAVMECADAAHGMGGHIISDGGITCPGDVAKAFGGGADFVMLGSFLAGTDEGGGAILIDPETGKKYIQFYGMSSKTAQDKHGSGLSEYRASEGRVIKVPYKGSIDPIVRDLLGGLRSACTYTGSRNLKELPKRTTFCLVQQQISTLYGVGELMS
jgi:GMP reductase